MDIELFSLKYNTILTTGDTKFLAMYIWKGIGSDPKILYIKMGSRSVIKKIALTPIFLNIPPPTIVYHI